MSSFNKDDVYKSDGMHIENSKIENIEEAAGRLEKALINRLTELEIENLETFEEELDYGGGFFSAKQIKAIGLRFKKGKLKRLASYFFVTKVGNIITVSVYQQASFGFGDLFSSNNAVLDPSARLSNIEAKLKSIEEVEEFSIFNAVTDWLYTAGCNSFR